ncbi:MAG: hypothetical protein JXN64_12080 [Spirochaetes bacterium]|nr:hypothetical protein [Spirochaetota bacterium]
MRNKIFITTLGLLLIVSCILNIFLFTYSINIYRQQKIYHIDPLSSLQHPNSNKYISKKSREQARVILFGDSRIYQWDPFPEFTACEIINRGIPGETTSQLLLHIERDVISLVPDIAVVQSGVNDCIAIGVHPELETYIIESAKNNIKEISKILNSKGIRTLILTVFPVASVPLYRRFFWSEKTRVAVMEINEYILKFNSSNAKVLDCDRFFLEKNEMKKEYANDMLHLNHAAYMKLNEHVIPLIEKFIKDIKPGY